MKDNKERSQPLVSILLPVYNVESYLPKCLDSILGQTYKNIEVILVNDKTLDNSGTIADNYSKNDPRILVIHKKKNTGLADTRNVGLKKATGQYVYFMDSDDYLDNDFIEELVTTSQKTKADVTRAYVVTEVEENDAEGAFGSREAYENSYNIHLNDLIAKDKFNLKGAVWVNLYRKKLIDKYGIKFNAAIRTGQDELWNLMIGYYANKVSVTPKRVYYHRLMREGSLMTEYKYSNEGILSRVTLFNKSIAFMNSKEDYPKNIYIDRFKNLIDVSTGLIGLLSDNEIACKVSSLLADTIKNMKYNTEILSQIGLNYQRIKESAAEADNKQKQINELNSEISSYLGLKRSAKLLLGNIKRYIYGRKDKA